jgi:hypothetical protein
LLAWQELPSQFGISSGTKNIVTILFATIKTYMMTTVQKTLTKFGEVNTELLRVSEISFQCIKIIRLMNTKNQSI